MTQQHPFYVQPSISVYQQRVQEVRESSQGYAQTYQARADYEDGLTNDWLEKQLEKSFQSGAFTQGSPAFRKLLDELWDLHIRKSAGYAGDAVDPWDNFRECEDISVDAFRGVLVRMSDKWKRAKNLVKNPNNEQVGEPLRDTLRDLASYALIAVALLDEMEARDE